MKPNDGGPAFPFKCQGETTAPEIYYGMSLRDYFAEHAGKPGDGFMRIEGEFDEAGTALWYARWAYAFADAMLAAREKGHQ